MVQPPLFGGSGAATVRNIAVLPTPFPTESEIARLLQGLRTGYSNERDLAPLAEMLKANHSAFQVGKNESAEDYRTKIACLIGSHPLSPHAQPMLDAFVEAGYATAENISLMASIQGGRPFSPENYLCMLRMLTDVITQKPELAADLKTCFMSSSFIRMLPQTRVFFEAVVNSGQDEAATSAVYFMVYAAVFQLSDCRNNLADIFYALTWAIQQKPQLAMTISDELVEKLPNYIRHMPMQDRLPEGQQGIPPAASELFSALVDVGRISNKDIKALKKRSAIAAKQADYLARFMAKIPQRPAIPTVPLSLARKAHDP